MNFINTLTADNTTAELACESRGVTRSQMLKGINSQIYTWVQQHHVITGISVKYFLTPLGLTVITRCVICEAVQDEYLSPLGTLIQSCQQLVDGLRVQVQQIAVGVRLCYLRQSCHRIGYHLRR